MNLCSQASQDGDKERRLSGASQGTIPLTQDAPHVAGRTSEQDPKVKRRAWGDWASNHLRRGVPFDLQAQGSDRSHLLSVSGDTRAPVICTSPQLVVDTPQVYNASDIRALHKPEAS